MEGVGSIKEVGSQPLGTVITPVQTQKVPKQCMSALTKSHKRWSVGESSHLTESSIEVDIFLELEFQVASFYSCIPRA